MNPLSVESRIFRDNLEIKIEEKETYLRAKAKREQRTRRKTFKMKGLAFLGEPNDNNDPDRP